MTTLKIATYKPTGSSIAARVVVFDTEQTDEYEVLQRVVDDAHDGQYPQVTYLDGCGAVYDASSPYYGETYGKFLGYFSVADLVVGEIVIAV